MKEAMENKRKSLGQEIIFRDKSKGIWAATFLLVAFSLEDLVRKSKITGTPAENVENI